MGTNASFSTRHMLVTATVALLALGAGFTTRANASCSGVEPNKESASQQSQGMFIRTAYDDSAAGDRDEAAVVGLWKFTFTSTNNPGIPNGAELDAGFVTWHSDHTEIMNSGRAPITQSFCMGVWKPVGHDTFKLNHFALSWDPTGTVFVGPANILEEITVDSSRNSYSGTVTINQYATDGVTVLAHLTGTVTGKRVTVD